MAYPTFTLDPYALIALSTVKEHLNIKEADTTQDNILTRMINSSTEMIENYLDRKILARSYTEFYDGRANDRMLLSNWPVNSLAEVWVDAGSTFTDPANKLDPSRYAVDGDGATKVGVVLLNGARFSKGTRNVKIIYNAGYTVTPHVLLEACVLHVEFMFDMRSDRRIGVQTKGKNQENTTFRGDLPEFVIKMLGPYEKREFPLAYKGVQNY